LALDKSNKQISAELNSRSRGKFPFGWALTVGPAGSLPAAEMGSPLHMGWLGPSPLLLQRSLPGPAGCLVVSSKV